MDQIRSKYAVFFFLDTTDICICLNIKHQDFFHKCKMYATSVAMETYQQATYCCQMASDAACDRSWMESYDRWLWELHHHLAYPLQVIQASAIHPRYCCEKMDEYRVGKMEVQCEEKFGI